MRKRSKGTPRRAAPAPPPPPEPYVPNWGEVDPDLYENILEWVDTAEID